MLFVIIDSVFGEELKMANLPTCSSIYCSITPTISRWEMDAVLSHSHLVEWVQQPYLDCDSVVVSKVPDAHVNIAFEASQLRKEMQELEGELESKKVVINSQIVLND